MIKGMRDRLMDLLIEAKKAEPDDAVWSEFLVDYLIEHGVLVPPCKCGDDVWWIDRENQTVHCAHNDIVGIAYYGNGRFRVVTKGTDEPEELHTDWCMLTEKEAYKRLLERNKK